MLLISILTFLVLLLDVLALRWGYDSRDKRASKDWSQCRKQYPLSH